MDSRSCPRCAFGMRINTLSPHAQNQIMRCTGCGYSEPASWADMAREMGIPEPEPIEPPQLVYTASPNTKPVVGRMEVRND